MYSHFSTLFTNRLLSGIHSSGKSHRRFEKNKKNCIRYSPNYLIKSKWNHITLYRNYEYYIVFSSVTTYDRFVSGQWPLDTFKGLYIIVVGLCY